MILTDKTVLLTGAARGIGQATAKELARTGADIIGVDLRLQEMQETAAAVEGLGRKFTPFACDITQKRAAQKMIKQAEGLNGGFDVLINNAGVLPSGPFWERDFEVWRRTIEINLLGTMHLTYMALPKFLQRNSGHIVNIASIAGKFGTEGVVAYAASKHGVVGFSSALRSELEGTNIGVSWICPSPARTRLSEGVRHTFLTPVVEPEQVALAVRKAIETNAIEVFVPGRVRLVSSIVPALSPRLARWILRVAKASRGWLLAKKELPEFEDQKL
ncbi:MAG: SDR family NAD(P)-dependent oxidoreductase [bacterium]